VIDQDYPDADIDASLIRPHRAQREIGYFETNDRYETRVIQFVRGTHRLIRADAEDVWQRTFKAFIRKVEGGRYKAKGYLAPLLFTIARRQARKLLKQRGRLPECAGKYPPEAEGRTDPPCERRELHQAIDKGIAKEIDVTAWERLVLTNWWSILKHDGYEPTPGILTEAIFGPVTRKAFGGDIYDKKLRVALTEAVRQTRNRALAKLGSYLKTHGHWHGHERNQPDIRP
jgi:hypothetical protein